MLTGTVRDNLALGIPPEFIDNSLVWEALERAQLSSFLQESRDGIDTVVGENGVQLSGGQRQRLGIARALYSRPKLLVLDEATSALDAETERIITETLDSLAGDVTLIVIAHRLATVRHCDQVIHLSGGRITGQGTLKKCEPKCRSSIGGRSCWGFKGFTLFSTANRFLLNSTGKRIGLCGDIRIGPTWGVDGCDSRWSTPGSTQGLACLAHDTY